MPELKTIKGRTTTLSKARRYFEGGKGERALAKDFLNMVEFDTMGLSWDQQMDQTRSACGNADPMYRGRRTVTYMHYVISPDARDEVSLDAMRDLATAWARRFFSDYQVAIVYHDDNDSHVMHAHVIVNNTNLSDGHRLTSDLTNGRVKLMNNALQTMALERGMSAFSEDHQSMGEEEMGARGRNVSREGEPDPNWRDHSRTRQAGFGSAPHMPRPQGRPSGSGRRNDKVQAGMRDRGAVSWKAEIADCVDVARRLARNERDFLQVLSVMGVRVTLSRQGDWLYHHPSADSRQVRGSRLGVTYTRSAIRTGMSMGYAKWVKRARSQGASLPSLSDEQVERIARSVSVVGRTSDARLTAADVCSMLDYNAEHGVTGYASYGPGPAARRAEATARALGVFDEGLTRQTERARRDARLVGRWIQEERTAAGAGGGEYGAPAGARVERARRGEESGHADDGGRDRGQRGE